MKQYVIWQNKNCCWNWLGFRIDKNEHNYMIMPIWNVSHNCQRAIRIGIWRWYIDIIYYRKGWFNQDRKLLFRKSLWQFYQLFF
jgi:hypothetical protein